MARIKAALDWLFKDLYGRRGKYVIAEVPNVPLALFMISIVLALVFYPGFFKTLMVIIAYGALIWWSFGETRSGRSRFRRILGYLGFAAVLGAVLLRIGFQMPGYKGHIVGAAVCNGAYLGALNFAPAGALGGNHHLVSDVQLLVGLFVIAVLFGLFPDIDTNSKGQDIFFGLAFVADCYLIYDGRLAAAAFLGLLAMTPILSHHRGWTHSKPAMVLVPLPIVLVPYLYNSTYLDTALVIYGAAVVGYFSHLLFDGKITRLVHIKGGGASN